MSHIVSPRLIETVVRKTLRDAKDSPERSFRNLVDLALYFSSSPAQQQFFDCVRQILCNEQSAYYPLIRDLLANVEEERLVSFGMTLGYNSFLTGARTLRALAGAGLRVPWFLTVQTVPGQAAAYQSLVQQGRELGIFTYVLLPQENPWELLPLASRHKDCAFILFCRPEDITSPFLEEAESLVNLALAIRCRDEAEPACQRLRKRRFLYALYEPYGGEEDLDGEEVLSCAENFHAPLAFFLPRPGCSPELLTKVYQQLDAVRRCRPCQTIPWDLFQDGQMVDQQVAGNTRPVYFDRDGTLHSMPNGEALTSRTLFGCSLEELFREAFPRE